MNRMITKRKRKRKSRSERNQLFHHFTEDQEEKEVKTSSRKLKKKPVDEKDKEKEAEQSIKESKNKSSRSLRSRKGVCDIPSLNDFKEQTANTITQKRLIVKRQPDVSFAKSKSSDWIKRAAAAYSHPECDSMKKKREQDMKEMLDMAQQLNDGFMQQKTSDSEPNFCSASSQDAAVQVQPTEDKSRSSICGGDTGKDTFSSTSKKSQQPPPPSVSSSDRPPVDSDFIKTPPKPANLEGDINGSNLMKSVADNMLREPQFCCFKIFNKRSYINQLEREILQKWQQRKRKRAYESYNSMDKYISSKQYRPVEEYETPSALSAFRPFPSQSRNPSLDDDQAHLMFATPVDSGIENSIFLPSASDSEPVFRICLNPEEMDTDQDEEDDESGLSLARYEYFIRSARKLEAEHLNDEREALRQMEKQQKMHPTSQVDEKERALNFEEGCCRGENFLFDGNPQCACCRDSMSSQPPDQVYGLSMSRHKLHTALQKACQQPSALQQDSQSDIFSILNTTNNDMDDIFEVDRTNDPWGLTDLRTHQVELQQQAHDFLNSHGPAGIKSRGRFTSPAQSSCSRISSRSKLSRNSRGSPVWLASSVLKDMVL